MNYQSAPAHRVSGFYRIFVFGVFALLFSLLLSFTASAADAVGATPGKFEVSNSGRASYTIPLALPPGINGVKPSLALRYRSGSGNGLLGVGWSISGLPVIHRCDQTLAQNGTSHGVDYSKADRLCLNGNQLREVSDGYDYWDSGAVYRTERERFVRITQNLSGANTWFEVEYKSGRKAEFGNTTDSRIDAANGSDHIRLWAISKLSDRNGNAVVYHYTEDTQEPINGSYRPDYIDYAGGTITFNYNTSRPDPIIAYYGGAERSQYARLTDITITATGGADIRRYAAAYISDTLTGKSQLVSIEECAGASFSTCFKPTTFSGQVAGAGWSSLQDYGSASGYGRNIVRTADINHDGIADLLDEYDGEVVVRFGQRSGQLSGRVGTGLQSSKWYVVNLDQDGIPALLSHTRIINTPNTGVIYRHIPGCYSQNGCFTQQPIDMPAAVDGGGAAWKFKFADLNNDGRDDILYLKNEIADGDTNELGKHTLGIIWRQANGWSQGSETELPFSIKHVAWTYFGLPRIDWYNTLKIIDMNNDDRPEILVTGSTIYKACQDGACLWVWQTASYQLLLTSSGAWQEQAIPAPVKSNSVLADVNGDGYPDLVNIYNVYLNNGQYPAIDVSTHAPAYNWPVAADLDGDGASELIYSNEHLPAADPNVDPDNVETYSDPDLDAYSMVRFSGGSFSQPVTIWPDAPNIWPSTPLKGAIQAADFNGDGLDDLWTDALDVRMNKGQKQIAVTSITNGFGTNWDISYTPLTNSNVYIPGDESLTYPRQHYAGTRQVVERYTVSDGTGGTYFADYLYEGAKVNVNGRGFLGFAKRTVTDSRIDVKVTEWFKQKYPYIGITKQKELTGSNGLISTTTITPNKKIFSFDQGKQTVLPYPIETVTKSYLLDQLAADTVLKTTTKKINSLDGWGNAESITIKITGGGKTFTTKKTIDYSNTKGTWCLGLPSSTTVTRTAHGGTHTQKTKADIDTSACRVNSQTLEGAPDVTTTYQYGTTWGNVTKTTVSATNADPAVEPRSIQTSYDTYNGRFPDTITNAAGHITTLTWGTTLGLKKSVTGPNKLKTTFSYDAFGRLIGTYYPDARAVELLYDWCKEGECPGGDNSVYRISAYQESNRKSGAPSRTSGADAVTIYDSFGRKVVTGTQGLYNDWSYRFTHYNHLGQVDAQSQPHLVTGQYGGGNDNDALKFSRVASALTSLDSGTGIVRDSGYWTNYTYDTLGRVTKVDHPNGGETTTIYSGFKVTVTNANGQETIKTKNAIGQTAKMTDAKGNITQYAYDAAGNLVKTTDPLLNVITMTYDNRGNKLTMDDPDMGSWKYEYNAFGEMVKQTDAKGQITKLIYDVMGRLDKRIEGEDDTALEVTTEWTYGTDTDTGDHDIGKLVNVTQSTGFEKTIAYGEYSRPRKTTITINGKAYTTTTSYDEFGRVAGIEYPASFPISEEKVTAVITSNATEIILGMRDIILDGSSSIGDDLSYYWEQTGGPDTPINNPDNVQVTIAPSEVGEYAFKLTVGNDLIDVGPNDQTSCLESLDDGSDDDASCIDVLQVIPPSASNFDSSEGKNGEAKSKDGSYTLSWQAPYYGLPENTQYYLYESTVATEQGQLLYDGVCVKEGACLEKTVHNRSNGDWHYELEVCLQNNTDLCSVSQLLTVSVKLPPAAPAAPGINDSYSTDGNYTVSWTVTNADYWYKLTETDSGATSNFTNPDVSYKVFSSKSNGTWHYALQACHTNFESCSGLSAENTVRVVVPPQSITVPSSSPGSETIEWDNASGNVDYYELEQSRSSSFSNPATWTTNNLAKTVTVSGNYYYYYRVRACYNDSGTYCTPWRAGSHGMRNYEPPGKPSSITASATNTPWGGAETVTVTWGEAPGDQNRYQLYRTSLLNNNGWIRVQNNSSRSYHQTASPPAALRYRVSACNIAGCSGFVYSDWVDIYDENDPTCIDTCPGVKISGKPTDAERGTGTIQVSSAETTPRQPVGSAHLLHVSAASGFSARPPARPYDLFNTQQSGIASVGATVPIANARAQKTGIITEPTDNCPPTSLQQGVQTEPTPPWDPTPPEECAPPPEDPTPPEDPIPPEEPTNPPPPPPSNTGDRFAVKYIYGHYGHLTQVVNYYDPNQVFWEAKKVDAFGHITQVKLGNGITTQRSYNQVTGRLTDITTGRLENSQVTAAIQNLSYQWDDIGNLEQRENLNQGIVETFTYDALNRIENVKLNSSLVTSLTYDAIGNIESKTTTVGAAAGTRVYTYGLASAGPHAVTDVGGNIYEYDANGNMITGDGRQITWDAANYPIKITQNGTVKTFTYGPAKQRYFQKTITSSGTTKTITVGGLYQKITNAETGAVSYQHYIRAAGKTIAIHTRTDDYTHKIEYLHRDHLGSIVAITDEDGDIVTRMRYDAFGKRTVVTGTPTDRGFTGHQMLDEVGLIHMNGRVYDPNIGRFLSADPNIPHPYNSQSYNRYSYVLNNPLSLVDPSGFVDVSPPICCGRLQSWKPGRATVPEFFQGMYSHGIGGSRSLNITNMTPSEVQAALRQLRKAGYVPAWQRPISGVGESWDRAIDRLAGSYGEFGFVNGSGWLEPTQTTLGGMGLFASLGEFAAGRTTIGSNFRLYASGWRGNGAVSTARIAGMARMTGIGALVFGTAFNARGVYIYFQNPLSVNAVHPIDAGLNFGFGAWSIAGGIFTAVPAGAYFLIDNLYPGGVPGALEDNYRRQKRIREIMDDPSWGLYGRGMGK